MKVFITGVAGTGKSTIAKVLNERGITAVDFSDNPKLRYWRHKVTKERAEYLPTHPVAWFDEHECLCDVAELETLFKENANLVVTGAVSGTESLDLFDKVLLLQCSPETIRNRMQTRDRAFGKTKEQQDNVVRWREEFDPMLLSYGAIAINTEGTLEDAVEKVLLEISKFWS